MIQFGGAFAAAGPIRAVSSRVLDVLPVVTRVQSCFIRGSTSPNDRRD